LSSDHYGRNNREHQYRQRRTQANQPIHSGEYYITRVRGSTIAKTVGL
jgi:hypothetical protein